MSVEYILLNYLINNDVLGKNLIAGNICLKNCMPCDGDFKLHSTIMRRKANAVI